MTRHVSSESTIEGVGVASRRAVSACHFPHKSANVCTHWYIIAAGVAPS
jgi:hypothetical protein